MVVDQQVDGAHEHTHPMTGRFARIREAQEGSSAVEMALVTLVVAILILGMIEFALAYWTLNQLQLAVEETGRYAMVFNSSITPATAESYMQNYLPGSSTKDCTSPSANQFCVNATKSGNTMTLTAYYGLNIIGLTGTFTIAGRTTVPLD
jgi:Flp pilus assembly protein TadG